MSQLTQARHARLAWNRVLATGLILTALFSPWLAGPRLAQASPAAQAQGLCSLMPPDYDPSYYYPGGDFTCIAGYKQPDGDIIWLHLMRHYSPEIAYQVMSCSPKDCALGETCNSQPCKAEEWGDAVLIGGHTYQGVSYAPRSSGGYGVSWTRGCYQLEGYTFSDSSDSREKVRNLMIQLDTRLGWETCAGCDDPRVCPVLVTITEPGAETTKPNYNMTGPDCTYVSKEDRLICTAQVVKAGTMDVEYVWSYSAETQETTASRLDISVRPDGKSHTVEVRGQDRLSGVALARGSTTVQVDAGGTGESIDIETMLGTTKIGGSNPDSANVVLDENSPLAKVLADCPELGLALLLEIGYDPKLARADPGGQPASIIISALAVDCMKLREKAEGPLLIAAAGNPARFLPARTAQEDLPVHLRIDLQGGPLHVNASSDQVLLDVQTPEVSVRSAGRNDFGVNLDAQTGDTTVAAYGGSIEVYSRDTSAQVASLEAGQQIEVAAGGTAGPGETSSGGATDTGASQVGPYGAITPPPADSGRSSRTSGPCGSLAVILPALAAAVARRRDHSAGAC